jgi:hypothetical protein
VGDHTQEDRMSDDVPELDDYDEDEIDSNPILNPST